MHSSLVQRLDRNYYKTITALPSIYYVKEDYLENLAFIYLFSLHVCYNLPLPTKKLLSSFAILDVIVLF